MSVSSMVSIVKPVDVVLKMNTCCLSSFEKGVQVGRQAAGVGHELTGLTHFDEGIDDEFLLGPGLA